MPNGGVEPALPRQLQRTLLPKRPYVVCYTLAQVKSRSVPSALNNDRKTLTCALHTVYFATVE